MCSLRFVSKTERLNPISRAGLWKRSYKEVNITNQIGMHLPIKSFIFISKIFRFISKPCTLKKRTVNSM